MHTQTTTVNKICLSFNRILHLQVLKCLWDLQRISCGSLVMNLHLHT